MRRRLWAVGALVGALAGCASDPYSGAGPAPTTTAVPGGPSDAPTPDGPSDVPPPDAAAVEVLARDNNFVERDVTVEAGTTVVWRNVGRNDHDVTPLEAEDDPASATWGVQAAEFAPQATYSHRFDAPGVYAYVCTIHGLGDKGMAGTVTVTG